MPITTEQANEQYFQDTRTKLKAHQHHTDKRFLLYNTRLFLDKGSCFLEFATGSVTKEPSTVDAFNDDYAGGSWFMVSDEALIEILSQLQPVNLNDI